MSAHYDIVHAQYGSLTALIAFLGRKGRPLIISFGGSDLLGSSGKGFNWMVRNWITRNLGLLAAHRCNKIIVKSESLKMNLPEDLHGLVAIIPNGVDLNVFYPRDKREVRTKLGWKLDDFYVLFTPSRANNVLVKNLPLANAVIDLVREKVNNVYLEFILDKAPEQVATLMNGADCLLLTSLHEGSPNVIKEAMACNLPIVTVNVGDVYERLKEVLNSYVIDSYEKELLSEKVITLLNKHTRTNGLEQLKKQNLTSEDVAKKIWNVYNEVFDDDRRSQEKRP